MMVCITYTDHGHSKMSMVCVSGFSAVSSSLLYLVIRHIEVVIGGTGDTIQIPLYLVSDY